MENLSCTFVENSSSLARVTNQFLEDNLDPRIRQRFDEGVGDYKNKIVFKLKDGKYYYFDDPVKFKSIWVKQNVIQIDESKISWVEDASNKPIKSGSISGC